MSLRAAAQTTSESPDTPWGDPQWENPEADAVEAFEAMLAGAPDGEPEESVAEPRWVTVEQQAAELHDGIWRAQQKRPSIFASDREIAARIHARQDVVRAAALAEPNLHPDVIRLMMNDPCARVSNAAYQAARRNPAGFEVELARGHESRLAHRISLASTSEEIAAYEADWARVDVYSVVAR